MEFIKTEAQAEALLKIMGWKFDEPGSYHIVDIPFDSYTTTIVYQGNFTVGWWFEDYDDDDEWTIEGEGITKKEAINDAVNKWLNRPVKCPFDQE